MTRRSSVRERSRNEAGFTLLELLVAITLLGLLMAALYGGLRFGVRAWERGEAHAGGTDEIRLAQTLLRRELERAYPYFLSGDLLGPRVAFEGTADAIAILAPAPGALDAAGRARIVIRRVEENRSFGLAISAKHELATEDGPGESEELLRGLRSLEFSYYGSQGRDEPPEWHESWIGRTRLPALIRVRAVFADTSRVWPELIVAPRLSADVGCIYDVLTNYCRGR